MIFVSDYGKIKEKYKEVLISNDIAWEEEKAYGGFNFKC
jgi:UDP-N-acetylmuramoylalanine--D-glutamate ligase